MTIGLTREEDIDDKIQGNGRTGGEAMSQGFRKVDGSWDLFVGLLTVVNVEDLLEPLTANQHAR